MTIRNIVQAKPKILRLCFDGLGHRDAEINLELHVQLEQLGLGIVTFGNVTGLKADLPAQTTVVNFPILIEDVSQLQWEGVRFKVSILDSIEFYCRDVVVAQM